MEAFQIPVRRSHHHVLIPYHKTIPLRQIRLTVTNKNHLILESQNHQITTRKFTFLTLMTISSMTRKEDIK